MVCCIVAGLMGHDDKVGKVFGRLGFQFCHQSLTRGPFEKWVFWFPMRFEFSSI